MSNYNGCTSDDCTPEASTADRRRGFVALTAVHLSLDTPSVNARDRRWLVVVALCAIASPIGCGGSSTPPPPAPVDSTVRTPSTESRTIGFARRAKEEVDDSVDLSGVDPDDVFDLATSPPPNFVVTGAKPPPKPEDRFIAMVDPAAGSSTFDVTSTAEQGGASESSSSSGRQAQSLPAGFRPVAGASLVDGLPSRIVCEADGSEMVLIPAGESLVGTLAGPASCVPEVPVYLNAFYISLLEVNVAQYTQFRSQSIKAGKVVEKAINVDAPSDYPALGIAWVEARAYAQATGRELPTECQWEKAARGSRGLAAPWGNGRPLWSDPRQPGQIDPCGVFPDDRSVFGVLDLAGNAQEWMLDFYDEANHETLALMDPGRRRNWAGPRRASATGERVVKGDGPEWAVWFRRGVRMTERSPNIGFRCVLNLTEAD